MIDDMTMDILKVLAPTNKRFTKVAYSDASFAVGDTKQSVTGFVVMVNGVPLLFGSLKQTVVVIQHAQLSMWPQVYAANRLWRLKIWYNSWGLPVRVHTTCTRILKHA